MIKKTAHELLQDRMKQSYKELRTAASKKMKKERTDTMFSFIAGKYKVSSTTVRNYVNGKAKNGNGYFIDALIKEFENY